MIENIADRIVEKLVLNHVIDMDEASIYQYGLEIMLSSVITLIITLIMGIVLHCVMAAMFYIVIFVALRSLGGGYHASTYLQCNLIFAFVTAAVLLSFKFIPMEKFTVLHYFSLLLSIMIIWKYAPVENENKPLSHVQRKYGRFLSVTLMVLLALLSCLLEIMILSPYSILIDMTVLVVSFSMFVTKIARGGDEGCAVRRKKQL